ncbi:hypothetical protein EMPS_01843 [Entomortierella parvispora]|uniref:LIM zinc-binding domain-containing protein n=1 Tax=Entomortierella parvispora TaxID=205924 RepID=A0A9P3H4B5_9FUNG|nr:hypothetical protein EMPS_01843 [Entomortierella parvispora]
MPPRFVPPTSPKCPRCSKSVYSAEQVIGPNGAAWHKSCFTCKECNRRLDSNTLAEHEGEAYCKACHKKMWGPTGYGYASNLLVREDPESQFKQSIGRPVNSSGSNSDFNDTNTNNSNTETATYSNLDQVVFNNTGGSGSAGRQSDYGSPRTPNQPSFTTEETEEQRRERLTPVNATLKKRNSLDMIREQAEASRRAYDEAHAQRVSNRYGRVNADSTGGSTGSTGSGARSTLPLTDGYLAAQNNNGGQSGYLSDSSSTFGSTVATTSSPAPSISSFSSSSTQPATKSLFLNQSYRGTSSSSHQSQANHDAETDFAKSRQALAFQTGAPTSSSPSTPTTPVATPALPKREVEPAAPTPAPTSQHGSEQGDDSYLDYVPVRVVARKEEGSGAPPPPLPGRGASAVDEDEWDAEPTPSKVEESASRKPMYRSQFLQQQQQQQQQEQQEQNKPEVRSVPSSRGSTSARLNRLISETDQLTLREQEQRQQTVSKKDLDEWDEEPTPTMPSKPQNLSYMPARHVSSAATRTWTPTAPTADDDLTPTHSRTSSAGSNPVKSNSFTSPVNASSSGSTAVPKTSYYRSGGLMTPKKVTSSFGGGGDICPRCQKTVYHAESALAPGGAKYHKLCLRCVECSKSLDSTNMTDRQGQPYCKTCYGKAFGAKGYGYGSGASMLHTEL